LTTVVLTVNDCFINGTKKLMNGRGYNH